MGTDLTAIDLRSMAVGVFTFDKSLGDKNQDPRQSVTTDICFSLTVSDQTFFWSGHNASNQFTTT